MLQPSLEPLEEMACANASKLATASAKQSEQRRRQIRRATRPTHTGRQCVRVSSSSRPCRRRPPPLAMMAATHQSGLALAPSGLARARALASWQSAAHDYFVHNGPRSLSIHTEGQCSLHHSRCRASSYTQDSTRPDNVGKSLGSARGDAAAHRSLSPPRPADQRRLAPCPR